MEGPVLVHNNNTDSNKNNPSKAVDHKFEPSSSSADSFNDTFTKVYRGSDNANSVLLQFIDRAKTKIDSVISYSAPSVIIEIEPIRERRKHAVKHMGLRLRYVTEITRDNIGYVREMLSFSEIRHLDGIRGNFEVADQREYVAVATLQEAQSLPHLIFSNIPEIVEQQQFVFDSFWKMATPAKQKISEIEHGVIPAETIVYSDYKDAVKKETELIRKANKEIQIMYSTVNAFHLQEKQGTLQLLKEMAEQNENLRISILCPIDKSIRDSSYLRFLRNHGQNIRIQDIAPSISIKIKSLVVDRKESLIMELRHLKEEKATALIGFSFYSNSESTVLSYASIFEVLYNQSILFEQLRQEDNVKNEFIDIAAHELRTPIMPILNGMEILEEKLGERVREYRREIDIITRNASRLQNLAESILQVSRIESGTFSLSIQSGIDIHSVIAQVIEDVEKKYAYTDKAGKVSIVFLPLFGTGKEQDKESNYIHRPLYVDCDPQKVTQVVFNLLDNAMKFTSEGKVLVYTTKVISNSSIQYDEDTPNNSNGNTPDKSKPHNKLGDNSSVLVTVQGHRNRNKRPDQKPAV